MKREITQEAREEIMRCVTIIYYKIGDHREEYSNDLVNEIKKQVGRIEKLFGYEVGSWGA